MWRAERWRFTQMSDSVSHFETSRILQQQFKFPIIFVVCNFSWRGHHTQNRTGRVGDRELRSKRTHSRRTMRDLPKQAILTTNVHNLLFLLSQVFVVRSCVRVSKVLPCRKALRILTDIAHLPHQPAELKPELFIKRLPHLSLERRWASWSTNHSDRNILVMANSMVNISTVRTIPPVLW